MAVDPSSQLRALNPALRSIVRQNLMQVHVKASVPSGLPNSPKHKEETGISQMLKSSAKLIHALQWESWWCKGAWNSPSAFRLPSGEKGGVEHVPTASNSSCLQLAESFFFYYSDPISGRSPCTIPLTVDGSHYLALQFRNSPPI